MMLCVLLILQFSHHKEVFFVKLIVIYFWARMRALTRFRAAPRRAGFILPTALPTLRTVNRWPLCLPQVALVFPDFKVIPSAPAWMEIALLLAIPEYRKLSKMKNDEIIDLFLQPI